MYIESGSESDSSWLEENFTDEITDYVINFLFLLLRNNWNIYIYLWCNAALSLKNMSRAAAFPFSPSVATLKNA